MAVTVSELTKEIEDAALLVHGAEDRKDDREFLTRAFVSVEQVAERFQELRAALSEGEKMKLERALGRRVQDLRRMAGLLPRIGNTSTSSTPDRRVDGPSRPDERKITGVSWRNEGERGAVKPTLPVGSDIEAWCGTCKDSTTHSVFAVVDGEPKVVTCKLCNARHSFRLDAPREKNRDGGAVVDTKERARIRALEEQQRRKQDELQVLAREVNAAECLPFDEKRRYKAGEIIDHPELGRGKVENVLRSSMLVRFARGGLKSVMLV